MAKRYHSLIGTIYNPNKIYVRSTDVDRTIASALSNMAGMFPPQRHQVWNSDIPWQPIPVHAVPGVIDYVMHTPPCPAFDKAKNDLMKTPRFKRIIEAAEPLFKYLSRKEGINVTSIEKAFVISDTLYIENLKQKM